MVDFGRSDNPQVQAQLDRLAQLSVPQGRFGLQTITALMDRLGNPHRKLPPVLHVAGTNGKGSVCAFLRAILEADGKRVHVTTSPHLVRYNERIRLAGELIDDAELAALLEEVLDVSTDLGPSFFEVTIAAAFLAFSRTPADACVVEVGLGGRFDATNVLEPAAVAVSGIAALGLDHERFLLAPEEGTPEAPMARIAFEKAGIAKKRIPLVTLDQVPDATRQIIVRAESVSAPLALRGDGWSNKVLIEEPQNRHIYRDQLGELELPLPSLSGPHQVRNAGLAVAMLRHQDEVIVSERALKHGLTQAVWPGRCEQLDDGPLVRGREVWIDGGHNQSAGQAMADFWADESVHVVIGMLANKDPEAILGPMRPSSASVTVVPVPGHDCHAPSAFGEGVKQAGDLDQAIADLPADTRPVFITGSLYLVGEALRLNQQIPQ
ncbi:MAG: folylpolyglutamate synthase/dihydrofolate synthase family protein [Pseudomonadota bacterium]